MLKEKDVNLTGDDVREGLTAIVSIKIAEPQFEGQTKTKLGNTEAKAFVQRVVNEQLGAWFEQNLADGKAIARKAQSAAVARVAARKARDAARSRKGLLGGGGLPGVSPDCQSTIQRNASCSSSRATRPAARPSRAATCGSRRSCRSAARSSTSRRHASTGSCRTRRSRRSSARWAPGCRTSSTSTGCGTHKIVLMADADVDGQHIRTLLLTLLFRFMRPVVEHGYVFLAQPPLYKIKWIGRDVQPEYAYSDRERDALSRAGLSPGKRLPKDDPIQRYKGLGEMNDDELWDTTMDPTQRILLQVTLEDAAQADDIFTTLMGEDVESRRQFIQRNARDVRFLDI